MSRMLSCVFIREISCTRIFIRIIFWYAGNLVIDLQITDGNDAYVAVVSDMEIGKQVNANGNGSPVSDGFVAPEVMGTSYTDKSDVFSFGMILWALVTKQLPVFPNASSAECSSYLNFQRTHQVTRKKFEEWQETCTSFDFRIWRSYHKVKLLSS